jgi:hypothetical protein
MTNADYVTPITFGSIINQAFLSLKQQYQLSLSVLLSFLSTNVFYLVVNCPTSANIWSTLKHVLTSPSNSQIMQLHGSIQDLYQGNDIVTIYLQKDKGLFDELVATGQSISLVDFNLYVF